MCQHRRHEASGAGVPVPRQEGRARVVSVGRTTLKQAETLLESGDPDPIA